MRFLLLLAGITMLTTSCKKYCTVCAYEYKDANDSTQVFTYPTYCGKDANVDSYELNCQADANKKGGFVANCTRTEE